MPRDTMAQSFVTVDAPIEESRGGIAHADRAVEVDETWCCWPPSVRQDSWEPFQGSAEPPSNPARFTWPLSVQGTWASMIEIGVGVVTVAS